MTDALPIIIAGYAAVVGTGSLGWQIYQSHADRRASIEPGVVVKVSNAFLTYPTEVVESVKLEVYNTTGSFGVQVSSAGLYLQDGSGRTYVIPQGPPGATIPGTAEPRHSVMTYFLVARMRENGFDLTKPLVGFASLGNGETVDSQPATLREP